MSSGVAAGRDRARALKALLWAPATEDRGVERIRRARLTSVTSIAAQAITLATSVLSIPLTVGYLGVERYGVWLTLNSLIAWLAVSDLGFGGNALVTAMADASGMEDREWSRQLAATAFWALAAIAAILVLIAIPTVVLVPWERVFNVSRIPLTELRGAVAVSLAGFLIGFPATAAVAIYHGRQEGYLGNAWAIAASVFSLGALLLITRVQGGLPHLVTALWGTRLLVSVLGAAYLFVWHAPWLRPSPRSVTRRALRRLSRLGVRFLVAQLAGIGMFQSQPIIVTQLLGPAPLAVFSIAQRVLTAPLLLVQAFTLPLMAPYAEALARGDAGWIRRTLIQSTKTATAGSLCLVAVLVPLTRPLIRFWVGPSLMPATAVVLLLGAYVVVAGIVTPASVMLYGMGRAGRQALYASANAVATVVLGILLTRFWGLAGMAAAMLVALALVNPIAQLLELRQAFRSPRMAGQAT
jgi:O-antigen/teichoic acid export membrane protein